MSHSSHSRGSTARIKIPQLQLKLADGDPVFGFNDTNTQKIRN